MKAKRNDRGASTPPTIRSKALSTVHPKPFETQVFARKLPPAVALLRKNPGAAAVHAVAGDHVDDAIVLSGDARVILVRDEVRIAAIDRRSATVDIDLFVLGESMLGKLMTPAFLKK